MKQRGGFLCTKTISQKAVGRGRKMLTGQSADQPKKAEEKGTDADAINHSKMDVFAWIDGRKRAQKPAFSFHFNHRSGHPGIGSISHAMEIMGIKPRRPGR